MFPKFSLIFFPETSFHASKRIPVGTASDELRVFHARVSAEVQAACLPACGPFKRNTRDFPTCWHGATGTCEDRPRLVAGCWVTPRVPSPAEHDTVRNSASLLLRFTLLKTAECGCSPGTASRPPRRKDSPARCPRRGSAALAGRAGRVT